MEGSPHSEKFRIAMGGLAAVAVIAVALAVALLVGGTSSSSSQPWSSWQPPDGGTLGATEIAEHVAPLYRQTASQQLDVVTLISMANPNASGTGSGSGLQVAVNTGTSSSTASLSLLEGKTIAYDLCGIGGNVNCSLGGTASAGRLLLLRREALELALYTFKYIAGTSNVVAVLPPGRMTTASTTSTLSAKPPAALSKTPTKPVTVAVLFVHDELSPWLSQPLSDTLSQYPPAVSQLNLWRQTEEAGLVDQITARGLFSERVESAQDGSNLLVLNQLPPS
jgi:hypothetical protein